MLLQSGMQARRESGSPTDIEDWVEQADEQGGGTLWKSAASQMGCAVAVTGMAGVSSRSQAERGSPIGCSSWQRIQLCSHLPQ